MEAQKKFSYRPDTDIPDLIEKGLSMYRNEVSTPNISENQLINICIRKAVKDLPDIIKRKEREYQKMESRYINEKELKEQSQQNLEKLAELIRNRLDIENQITSLLNL